MMQTTLYPIVCLYRDQEVTEDEGDDDDDDDDNHDDDSACSVLHTS